MIGSSLFIIRKDVVQSYIDGLKSQLPEDEAAASPSEEVEETVEAEAAPATASDLPQYESGEDYDKATTYKMEAADLKSAGDYTSALDKYNQAITSAPPSALLLANRADVLFKLERFSEAVADCNVALANNPDRWVVLLIVMMNGDLGTEVYEVRKL